MQETPIIGDTAEHAWMIEFLDRCFPESGDRANADLKLVAAMCKAEPKYAQFTMQKLAQDIRLGQLGQQETVFIRFALGVLFTAYVALSYHEGRCRKGTIPAELELPVRMNPEIVACANELGPI